MRRFCLVCGILLTWASTAAASSLPRLVERIAQEEGLDPKLALAVAAVESGFNPYAVSHKGAKGVMQLMPSTMKRWGVRNPFEAEQNVRAGVRELKRLLNLFEGNVVLALAAYNAGENAVRRHGGVPPYGETRRFVAKVLRLWGKKGGSKLPVRILRTRKGLAITNLPRSGSSPGRLLSGGFGRSAKRKNHPGK